MKMTIRWDAILRGEIREELCEKVSRAPFDEKLSVISLLLTRLGTAFRNVWEEELRLELLMKRLKSYGEQEGGRPRPHGGHSHGPHR